MVELLSLAAFPRKKEKVKGVRVKAVLVETPSSSYTTPPPASLPEKMTHTRVVPNFPAVLGWVGRTVPPRAHTRYSSRAAGGRVRVVGPSRREVEEEVRGEARGEEVVAEEVGGQERGEEMVCSFHQGPRIWFN